MLIHVQIELQFQIQIKKIFRSNLRIIMTTSQLSLLRIHKIIIALVRSLSFRTSGSKFWRMLYLLGALPFSDVSLLLLNLILGKSEKFLTRILVLVCPRLSPDHPYVRFFVGIATSIHAKLFSMSHCYHASNLNPECPSAFADKGRDKGLLLAVFALRQPRKPSVDVKVYKPEMAKADKRRIGRSRGRSNWFNTTALMVLLECQKHGRVHSDGRSR